MGKYFSSFFSLSVFKESCRAKETHVNKLKGTKKLPYR